MKYILVIDSGFGGSSIIKELRKNMPNINYIYYVDNKNSPYGEKTTQSLNNIALNIVEEVSRKYSIKLVVLACNTLTVSSIDFLRKKTNYSIVGTEPNIKISTKPCVVIATPYTICNCKLLKSDNFIKVPLRHLSKLIDKYFNNFNKCYSYLKANLPKSINDNQIILGCTHYTFVKQQIERVYRKKIKFYENQEGVVRRIKYLLKDKDDELFMTRNVLMLSKNNRQMKKKLKKYLNK